MLQEQGPLLIAANHPNSFLDAIIVGSLFKSPVYSLARGDAFAGNFIAKILRSFNMLPVYRVSEGIENIGHNYSTFDACRKLFAENKIVLIFSEGRCINEWHLRPLKKGTARLALNAWQNNIPLKILPLGINYSSFRFFGKNVFLKFGNIISRKDFSENNEYIFTESITGVRNGLAFFLISSLFSHKESVLPFIERIFKGVTPIESMILNWPFKKSVTGKIFSVSAELFTGTALFFFPEQAVKKMTKRGTINQYNFCITQNYE